MHAVAEIVIPPGLDVVASVKQVMDYFLREDDEGNKTDIADWWDFYVIGGRFSGNKLEATIDKAALDSFYAALTERKVTVAGLRCGKPTLEPASQIATVDALWREMVPGKGAVCPLFSHGRDQYRREGYYEDDVCKVADLPPALTAERLIVAQAKWDDASKVQPARMWAAEYWNGVEHQKAAWSGNVKDGLAAMQVEETHRKISIGADWLVITVDYHN